LEAYGRAQHRGLPLHLHGGTEENQKMLSLALKDAHFNNNNSNKNNNIVACYVSATVINCGFWIWSLSLVDFNSYNYSYLL
jgi:hypothetical protein